MFGRALRVVGVNPEACHEKIRLHSLNKAGRQQQLSELSKELAEIIPDISDQIVGGRILTEYARTKTRLMHAFQVRLVLRALKDFKDRKSIKLVDIGDSSGNHILYLKSMVPEPVIDSISVNLDKQAVERIKAKGLKAVCVRAEELELESGVDIYMSFETLEHLTDPTRFLHRLAVSTSGNRLILTVPYRRHSQVGLKHLRPHYDNETSHATAEETHIFELSPGDWNLLFKHAGWEIVYDEIYYQYPRRHPFSPLFKRDWLSNDFEGFYGVILKKNLSSAERYLSW